MCDAVHTTGLFLRPVRRSCGSPAPLQEQPTEEKSTMTPADVCDAIDGQRLHQAPARQHRRRSPDQSYDFPSPHATLSRARPILAIHASRATTKTLLDNRRTKGGSTSPFPPRAVLQIRCLKSAPQPPLCKSGAWHATRPRRTMFLISILRRTLSQRTTKLYAQG
jgi:hypothetical protein